MKTILLLLCCFSMFSVMAQKRKKKTPFAYSYTIGDEEEERIRYTIHTMVYVSVTPADNDSLIIEVNCGDETIIGQITVRESNKQQFFFFEQGKFIYKIARSTLKNTTVDLTLDAGGYSETPISIKESDISNPFMITMEESTILNDPDSGGIIIHSKQPLSPEELDKLVRCYLIKEQQCYDPDEILILIIL